MTVLTFPQSASDPEFDSVTMATNTPTVKSESLSGRRQVRQLGSQRWSMTLSYPRMTRASFMPIMATIMKLRGSYGTFTIMLPLLSNSQGNTGGTWTCSAGASGSTAITLSGGTGSFTVGDIVRFSNHSKVYMIVGWSSNVMSVEPPLSTAVTTSTTIEYNNVKVTASLANDQQEFSVGTEGLFRYEIDIIEAL